MCPNSVGKICGGKIFKDELQNRFAGLMNIEKNGKQSNKNDEDSDDEVKTSKQEPEKTPGRNTIKVPISPNESKTQESNSGSKRLSKRM